MAQRTKIQLTGAETVTAHVPLQRKGQPWTMQLRPVLYFPELGETAADAETFAASISDSLRGLRDRRLAEIAIPSIGYDETAVPMDTKGKRLAPPAVPARGSRPFHSMHSPDIAVLAARFNATPRAERRASVARFAARLEAERAVRALEIEAAAVASALASSGPTADQLLADQHYAENVTAAAAARSHGRKPRKAALVIQDRTYGEAVAAVPDAFTVCNGCEVRPMVASEHPGYAAGLCAECYAEATAPEPETAEPVSVEPEPVAAPVLTVVPSRSRPTCERCGQTFRVSGTGYAWHVANRPDCASKRLAVVA